MNAFSVEAFAKVNRDLRVLGKRPDGYHELDTIFQTIDLTDRMDFLEREDDEVQLTIEGASHTFNAIHPLVHVPRALELAAVVSSHFIAAYS